MSLNSFKSKVDYYGLSASNIVLISTTENKKSSNAEALGEDGFIVANLTYGENSSPSQEFVVKSNATISNVQLGKITTVDGKSYCLASVGFTTGAGEAPKVTCSGKQVENNASDSCLASLASVSVEGLYHAQTFNAFTYTGTGVHLTKSSLDATCNVVTADKEGIPISHDITDGRVVVKATLQVSDSTYPTPTVTPAAGWVITSPLTETNPDADFPTYTFEITKYLTATHPAS